VAGCPRASKLLEELLDELDEVQDLLELAPGILVELAFPGEDVQLLEQLEGLARTQLGQLLLQRGRCCRSGGGFGHAPMIHPILQRGHLETQCVEFTHELAFDLPLLLFDFLLHKHRRQRRRHQRQHGQAKKHHHHRECPPGSGAGHEVAIAYRGRRGEGQPQAVLQAVYSPPMRCRTP
jgi:hypothetical protein